MSREDTPDPTYTLPHFRIHDHTIEIRASDSTKPVVVSEEAVQIKKKGKSLYRWNKVEPYDSERSKYWRGALGDEIAHKFLLLDPRGRRAFELANFPLNYKLYSTREGIKPFHPDSRTDAYLKGGGHTFRSPNEFLFHLAWIMVGQPPKRCRCVYCNTRAGGKQTPINKKFKEQWQEFLEERDDQRRRRRNSTVTEPGPVPHPHVEINCFNEKCFLLMDDE